MAIRPRLAGFVALAALAGCALLGACGADGGGSAGFEVKTIEAGAEPEHLAYGYGALWVSTNAGVTRLDPKGGPREVMAPDAGAGPIATGEGAVWAGNGFKGTVTRIDPATRRHGPAVTVSSSGGGESVRTIAAGGGAVWVGAEDKLLELDPASGAPTGKPIVIGGYAKRAVIAGDSVWVLIGVGLEARGTSPSGIPDTVALPRNDGTLVQVDPRRRRVVRRLKVGESPADLAAGAGSLWVVDAAERGGLRRLDPRDGHQEGRASEDSGDFVAVDDEAVWISDRSTNKVGRFALKTGELSAGPFTVQVEDSENSAEVGELALGAGSTWVGSPIGPEIGRIEP